MHPVVNNTTLLANNATVKIKLSPDDRFIGHDVIKQSPTDDVKVIIDKQPAMRTISPPPTVYRSVSPAPAPVTTVVTEPPRRKAPVKNIVTKQVANLEEFQSPIKSIETVKLEAEP